MKMIPATCECGEAFLREPHDDNPRCSECFFEHDVPDLKRLTDQVSKEEQRGPNRQEENRAATTETPERNSVMEQSTAPEIYGYTTENFRTYHEDPETFHLRASSGPTVEQHVLKRQQVLRVRHTSGPTEEDEDYIDFHLYQKYTEGKAMNSRTLVAVDATSGQWLAQLDMAPSNFAELAIWLTEQFSKDVKWKHQYNEKKARHEEERRRRLIRDHNTVDAQVRAQEGEPA